MTQKSWPWSTAAAVGDGSAELNEASSREFLAHLWVQDLAAEGVFKGLAGDLAGELEVSGASSPLTVQPGAAICYGLYMSDAVENLAVSTPSVGTTGFRVVLRTNWAGTSDADVGEARTRLAVVESSDGVSSIPALTQSFGTTWEISLATGTITTGGAITLTDDRTFRKATGITDTDELEDLAVTTAKLAADAVTAAKIAAGAVGTSEIANRTREVLLPITGTSAGDDDWVLSATSNQSVYTFFKVPSDYVSNLTVKAIVYHSAGTGDAVFNLVAWYGAVGEAWDNHQDSTGFTTVAIDSDQIQEALTLTPASIAAGDFVRLQFIRDGGNGSDTYNQSTNVLGFLLSYTADS